MPHNNRKKLILDNDRLLRIIIRLRDKVCQKTHKSECTEVAHFIGRDNMQVRWDPDNVCLLTHESHAWAHANPNAFRLFWLKRLGQERFDLLNMRARVAAPIKEYELEQINETLRTHLERITRGA